jgi:hypothetical protein
MRKYWLRKGLKVVVFATVAIGVFGFLVMSLWNWLMPALFGRSLITFWQAVGLLVLSKILFSGVRGRLGPAPWYWRRRLMERWDQMTPEERAKFRQGLQSRCGPLEPPTARTT